MVDRLGEKDLAIEPLSDLVMDDPNHEEAARLLLDLFERAGRTQDLLELLGRYKVYDRCNATTMLPTCGLPAVGTGYS